MTVNPLLAHGSFATAVEMQVNQNSEQRALQSQSPKEIKGEPENLKSDLATQDGNYGLKLKSVTVADSSGNTSASGLLASPITQVTLAAMLGIGLIGCSIPIVKAVKRRADDSSEQRDEANDQLSNRLEAYLEADLTKGVWWQRPVWGQKTTIQRLLKPFYRKRVPKGILFIHGRELEQITPLAGKAQVIDSDKFKGSEFVEFLRIRQQLYNNSGVYEGLENSFRLLNTAIEAKTCFEKIWQIEFRFLSSKQQECYRLVDALLANDRRGQDFQDPLQEKIDEVLPFIFSEEGQEAIRAYGDSYIKLSSFEFGLDLMLLFKQYKMSDYVVLVTVDKILRQYKKEDLTDFRTALIPVTTNFDVLEKLGPIIQLPKKKAVPETFARMLQFVAMLSKHEDSYDQFQNLMKMLEEWNASYQAIAEIRRDYGAEVYRQPKAFSQKIPGETLYEKYQQWFSSNKTQA